MQTNEVEVWKDIPGYEGWYQVSNMGRVKRIKKPLVTHGKRVAVEGERILKPSKAGRGYVKVKISNGIESKYFNVHRLVAKTFIPNPENKPQVDHINRDKTDNRVENLRWATNSENHFNMEHRSKLTAFGMTKSYTEWSKVYGISDVLILERLRRGWSAEDAVSHIKLSPGVYYKGR